MRTEYLRWKLTIGAAAVLVATGLGGCTAEKVEEGAAPDVEVDVDPGRWPEYRVNWADVDVGTRERTVQVPVVRVVQETREVSVPYIDINPPGARDREERMITLELDVPNSGYQVQIVRVLAAEDNLWVVGRLTQTEGAAAQGVTRVSDQIVVNAPADLDVRKIIVGERPPGVQNQQYRFVASEGDLQRIVPNGARAIYQRGAAAE